MRLQEKLLQLRQEWRMTQEALAERIGVSRQAVAKWEAGQAVPDLERLIRLGACFRISLDELVMEPGDPAYGTVAASRTEDPQAAVTAFLLRAKRACYAGKGAEADPTRPLSHDLRYGEGDLLYIDTYLGGPRFAGEEALWRDGRPFWAMNYVGRVLAEGFSGDFLKESLLLVPPEYPYRGPLVHQSGADRYHCVVEGEFTWFSGFEEIFHRDVRVYECRFHGGTVIQGQG